MSESQDKAQSPELTGGAGFTFEDAVVAVYLSALLEENTAPALPGRIVVRVATQQAAYGEPLDDLIVGARGADGEEVRLSLQVKRELTISAARTNTDFREIVLRSYETLNKPEFRDGLDRVGAITGTISDAAKRALETICEWARDCSSLDSFQAKFSTPGVANSQHRSIINDINTILEETIENSDKDAERYRLLRHFVLLRFDLLHEGSLEESSVIARLRSQLHSDDASRADDLWRRLRLIAREAAGRSADFQRHNLLIRLYGSFRFVGAQSLRGNLSRLLEEAHLALADITNEVDGIKITRTELLSQIKSQLERYKFVQIVGLPGTGKSVVFRELAESYLGSGSVIILKADRLTGPSWAAQAQSIGLTPIELVAMLAEVATTGTPTLFIDGLDRVEIRNRGIVLDIVNTILGSSSLNSIWRIVATLRDNGVEPLRTWLPAELFRGDGVSTITVNPFDDRESKILATAKPALRPLLFGQERVREIARRPFFTTVLARALTHFANDSTSAPKSEIDLVNAWWAYGGYNAEPLRLIHCQRALVQLAQAGANSLGRRVRLDNLDLDAITQLKNDGILRDVRPGHSVKFAHDIFFEWSFVQFLIGCEENWLAEIQTVGEPPVLGRVVELVSQNSYLSDENWATNLDRIEVSSLRPQWTRAWLLGPLSIPSFLDRESIFAEAVFPNHNQRLAKLAIWFQAEKTMANPFVLNGSVLASELSRQEIIQLADLWAWPSDLETWRRCCNWFLENVDRFPVKVIPDLVSVFEVWQNAFSDISNSTSSRIISTVKLWLEDIEDRCHSEGFSYERGQWEELRGSGLEELEKRLRTLFIRSSRIAVEDVNEYLTRLISRNRLRHNTFQQILSFSLILSETLPNTLVDFCLSELLNELPNGVAARPRGRRLTSRNFRQDWENLAIDSPSNCFSPPSPLREPFASLFKQAPSEAFRLVRDLANHAITAWLQLFELDWEHRATPIPLVLNFPWGEQTFWGDEEVYKWFRGYHAPDVVRTGLMALENWAFTQIEQGRDVDEVIREVVSGQQSCAVLGIAVALALSTQRVSQTTLPLVTSQRLWRWDIRRSAEDASSTNLIGFFQQSDKKHSEAVRESNSRNIRRLNIRCLALLFILNPHEELRAPAQTAIQSFPENLPFDLEEERQSEEYASDLRRTGEIWAEIGRQENYSASLIQDRFQIELSNPRLGDPDMVEMAQRHATLGERWRILNWVHDCFEQRCLLDTIAFSVAQDVATRFDSNDLFAQSYNGLNSEGQRSSIVAGVAAVVLCFSEKLTPSDLDWAQDIIFRAANTPEQQDGMWRSSSLVLDHPCLYAVHGLTSLIKRAVKVSEAKQRLIKLASHPLEKISQIAIGSALELWSIDANFVWIVLDLGIQLSIGSQSSEDELLQDISISVSDEALRKLEHPETEQVSLTEIPAPWVFASPRPYRGPFGEHRESAEPVWREPDVFLRYDFLLKVLAKIPVQEIMSDPLRFSPFLEFCDALVNWTIERMAPSWMQKSERDKYRSTELMDWRSNFYQFLARVALQMNEEEVRARFLEPVFRLDDKLAASLIRPFLSMLVCSVMDAPTISETALSLVQMCLPNVLQYGDWNLARQKDGRLYDFDVPDIVSILLFIHVEHAPRASRFANGNWREIEQVMPIIDPFILSVGDVASVTSRFISLCERSIDYYPPHKFVEQILTVLAKQPTTPVGWRGTSIPSRIACLIQAFAERTQPLPLQLAQGMLRVLDALVDMGDRRAAALQISEMFKDIRLS